MSPFELGENDWLLDDAERRLSFLVIQRNANTKLMTERTVKPPYTHPRCEPIQTATGVPASSAKTRGTIKGVQHGLARQAIANITPPRNFFNILPHSAI